ncbi:MAG: hypothetical protein J6Y93_02395 [Treponema sp.]|nr:hypothetical protein [Treponema sp.]
MEYLVIFLAVCSLVALLMGYSKLTARERQKYAEKSLRTQKDESGATVFVTCPVCNTPLAKTENMTSKIYRPMTTPDQRMTINGCPHCYPKREPGVRRSCPVCHKEIPMEGYLIARLFNRTEGKKHVMITGCTVCYKIKT